MTKSWAKAEESILNERSRDRRAELKAVDVVLEQLDRWLTSGHVPAKWEQVLDACARHNISPTGPVSSSCSRSSR